MSWEAAAATTGETTHEGVSFSRAYMQGGFNGATCVPSRAMLLSGQSLFHNEPERRGNQPRSVKRGKR